VKYHLILENADGDQIDMSATALRYMMSNVTGLDPPAASVSTSTYATRNGCLLNRAFLEKRNIVISFEMRGIGIEARRHALYQVVKTAQPIRVYYRTSAIDAYADGIVETCEINRFQSGVSGQISILCPDVYFYSCKETVAVFGSTLSGFKFPFAIEEKPGVPLGTYRTEDTVEIINEGDEVGLTIDLEAHDGVVYMPTIYNADTGAYLRITGEIQPEDKITISTKRGSRTVTLTRNGVTTVIMNRWVSGNTWFTLPPGASHFYLTAVSGLKYLTATFHHTDAYLGV